MIEISKKLTNFAKFAPIDVLRIKQFSFSYNTTYGIEILGVTAGGFYKIKTLMNGHETVSRHR